MAKENVHSGHRERLRKRFMAEGIDHFEDYEVLELLLQFPVPRVDTNPLAHRLIDRFGSLPGVMDASVRELMTVDGVGNVTASFLHAMPGIFRRYMMAKESSRYTVLRDAGELCEFAKLMYIGRTAEAIGLIGLDSRRAVKFKGILFEGDRNQVYGYLSKICSAAQDCMANSIVLTHNHPNGSTSFSPSDRELTRQVIRSLDPFNIELADHILVIGESFAISMEEIGLLEAIRNEARR